MRIGDGFWPVGDGEGLGDTRNESPDKRPPPQQPPPPETGACPSRGGVGGLVVEGSWEIPGSHRGTPGEARDV